MKCNAHLNNLSRVLLFGLIFSVLCFDSIARVSRTCGVRYESSGGWSNEYFMSVSFLSGSELNAATSSLSYSSFAVYAALWFGKGEVAVVKLDRPILGVGESFGESDFSDLFEIFSEVEGKDQQGKKWRIRAKIAFRFIDELSQAERQVYGIGSILGSVTSPNSSRITTPPTSSGSKVGVVVLKKGSGDWFIVNSSRGFAVLEWYGGYDPDVGDIVSGDFESFGFKNVRIRDRETRIWVEDFWLSQSKALEIYGKKAR